MTTDMTLVREYAGSQSEAAFEQLVARHLNLVYSTALRQAGDAHLAEEIAQAVFIALARKAGKLGPNTIVPAWLYRATRFAAANAVKQRRRQQHREQEAYMQSLSPEPAADEVWQQIRPLLDAALDSLAEAERTAVLLRYFEDKSLAEVGETLGLSADAARMRVNRALEKLRSIFIQQGVTLTAPGIAGAITAHALQTAPAAFAKTVSLIAAAQGATAGGTTLTLAKGTLKLMAWTKLKITAAVGVGLLLVAGTATMVVVSKSAPRLLPLQTLPNPNGYDGLIAAGNLVSLGTDDYEVAGLALLRAVAATNASALARARSALGNQCQVPQGFSETAVTRHITDELPQVKKLAQAFTVEGLWATAEKRPADAARSYLDIIRLGVESARGGLIIDQLVGTACEAIGTAHLQKLTPQLDAKTCRAAAQTLETLDARRQSWEDVMQQEQNWSGRTFPGLANQWRRAMNQRAMTEAYRKGLDRFHNGLLSERQVLLALAERAYTLDKGHRPAAAADLVPDYLQAVPKNPITGNELTSFTP